MEKISVALTKGLSKIGQPVYSAKIKEGLICQLNDKVNDLLSTDLEIETTKNGVMYINIGTDETSGNGIYYVLEPKMTIANPNNVTSRKSTKEKVDVDVPSLF